VGQLELVREKPKDTLGWVPSSKSPRMHVNRPIRLESRMLLIRSHFLSDWRSLLQRPLRIERVASKTAIIYLRLASIASSIPITIGPSRRHFRELYDAIMSTPVDEGRT